MRFPDLSKARTLISTFVYGGAQPIGVSGLLLDADFLVPDRQIPFRFERREGFPASENLFYSHGPLSNDHHQQVLDAIEEALTGKV